MKVNGLVLAGGGARGAYQIGVIKALKELGYEYSVVTGASVGAINACLLGSNKFDVLFDIWKNIDFNSIIEHKYKSKNKARETFIKGILSGGLSIAPLEKMFKDVIFQEEINASGIKTGFVYTKPLRKYCSVVANEVKDGRLLDYLSASCSATPFLKKKRLDGKKCFDGFYSDNLPVKLAVELGANKIIAVDIMKGFRKKVDTKGIDYLCIKPSRKLGFFLDFSNDKVNKNIELGYKDVMDNKEKILEFINK